MRLIMIGAEYAGKTTLGQAISTWIVETMGAQVGTGFHDHFVVPNLAHPAPDNEAEAEQVLTLMPSLLEKFQRYMVTYHLFAPMYRDWPDLLMIDWYYADAVYAPLYYGYGGPGEYGDRSHMVRSYDREVLEAMPDMVLMLAHAAPEVIRQRMRDAPHPRGLVQDQDVERVLDGFREQFDSSLIGRRIDLDTSSATVDETLKEFVRQIEPHFTPDDHQRIVSHRALQ